LPFIDGGIEFFDASQDFAGQSEIVLGTGLVYVELEDGLLLGMSSAKIDIDSDDSFEEVYFSAVEILLNHFEI
jgi:hypothetical protein